MIYVIYFFALIGVIAFVAMIAIMVSMIMSGDVSHKNDINPIHFNKPDND